MDASSLIHSVIDWLQARARERTSWDGLTIIGISVLALIASPIIRYVAWRGLAEPGLRHLDNLEKGKALPLP